MDQDRSFARLVSLACHDLRTPLATVHGFARTLTRMEGIGAPADRYLGMIEAASLQLGELLDDLGTAARIESGRYEPALRPVDTLELARRVAVELGDGRVDVSGSGGEVYVDPSALARALHNFARCALRHGALETVELRVEDAELELRPVGAAVAPILLGENLRDLGAAVAVRVVAALGGSATVEEEALRVRLPRESPN